MAIAAILARKHGNDLSREELEEQQRREKFSVVFEAKEKRAKAKEAFDNAIEAANSAEKEAHEAHEAEQEAKKEVSEAEAAEREAERESAEAEEAERKAAIEMAEAEAAEADATRELKEADEEENKLATMEADLAAGNLGVTEEQVQQQREKALRERAEAVAAVEKAKQERAEAVAAKADAEKERAEAAEAAATARKERAEAMAAMDNAKKERLQATEAQAKAAADERRAERDDRIAAKAERNAEATVWKQERVKLMMPLLPRDDVFKMIVKPAYDTMQREKKGAGKVMKRRLQRQFEAIHRTADLLYEDYEFLTECFKKLRHDEEIDGLDEDAEGAKYMDEDAMRLWITVLNHGEEPDDSDMEDLEESVDRYRETLVNDPDDSVPCAGMYEFMDFLVVTFDYYLAMGATRMRYLFIDLLLT